MVEVAKSLNEYFNNFLPSFLDETVPKDTPFPYLTYNFEYENMEDTILSIKIWTRSTSYIDCLNYAREIELSIDNGITLKAGNGTIWLRKGSPFCQFLKDEDRSLKVAYINLISNVMI